MCSKSAPFANLAVDEFVQDILKNTSDSQEQVAIEPNGRWRAQGAEPERKRSRYSSNSARVDDDDDISIVSDTRLFNGTMLIPKVEGSSHGTSSYSLNPATPNGRSTATASREPSSVPRSGGTKRTAEVIDLTLSSDEDDEPIARPPKRQNHGQGLNDGNARFQPYGY